MARGRMPLSFSTRTGVASALLLDDDTVRDWYRAYERGGVEGLKSVGHEGSNGRLERSVERVGRRRCPRNIRKIWTFLKRTFGVSYDRSGLIALLHRLGFAYRKPEAMPRNLDDPDSRPSSMSMRTCSIR